MANPISYIVITHKSVHDVQGIQDRLAKPAAESREAAQELINLIAGLAAGTHSGTIRYRLDNGTNITAATEDGTFTAAGEAGMTVTIGSVVLTEGVDWAAGATATTSATALAAAINADAALVGILSATSAAGVVSVTYDVPGRVGNLVELATNSAANFTWGDTELGGATSAQDTAPRTWDFGGT